MRQYGITLQIARQNAVQPLFQAGGGFGFRVFVGDTGITAQEVQKRPVTEGPAEGKTTAFKPGQVLPFTPADFGEQAALANPGLAKNRGNLPPAGLEFFKAFNQRFALRIAADERGGQSFDPAGLVRLQFRMEELIDRQRLTFAFDLDGVHFLEGKGAACQTVGVAAHENLARFRGVLQPCSDIDGIAHHGVAHMQVVSDVPCNHHSRVDPDVHVQGLAQFLDPATVESLEIFAHGNCGAQSVFRVIFQCDRSAEDGHDAVPDELVDHAFILVNRQGEFLEAVVDEAGNVLGVEPFGESGKAGNVRKNDRDLSAFALDLPCRARLVGQLFRDIALELCEQGLW